MKTKKFLKYIKDNYLKIGNYYVDKDLAGAMPDYAPPMYINEIHREWTLKNEYTKLTLNK